jgi:murein DD-endopeptidase MepM/ murein hydrolase activator NlpD
VRGYAGAQNLSRIRIVMLKPPIAALPILLALSGAAAAQQPPSLSLPIDCAIGKDCFIQQYTDVDPGAGQKDYRCGIATYEGHKGTDFRVLSVKAAEAGVRVLASAAGRVKGVRDGVEDRLVAGEADRQAVKDRECGNGVVLDHGGGWETQYCHMRKGTIAVRSGQAVEAGAPLGMVGYSGEAQFAHVHLSVRKDGAVVDPFLGDAVSGKCMLQNTQQISGLWQQNVWRNIPYSDGQIIETGFATRPIATADVETGGIEPPAANSPALVFYARAINMRAGDSVRMSVEGPGGFQVASPGEPVDRTKAQYVGIAGKKRNGAPWASGPYRGVAEVIRGGQVVGKAEQVFELQ